MFFSFFSFFLHRDLTCDFRRNDMNRDATNPFVVVHSLLLKAGSERMKKGKGAWLAGRPAWRTKMDFQSLTAFVLPQNFSFFCPFHPPPPPSSSSFFHTTTGHLPPPPDKPHSILTRHLGFSLFCSSSLFHFLKLRPRI